MIVIYSSLCQVFPCSESIFYKSTFPAYIFVGNHSPHPITYFYWFMKKKLSKLSNFLKCMHCLVTSFSKNALSWLPSKLNIHLPRDSTVTFSGICPREMQIPIHTETCTQIFTAILLTTVKHWKQSHREVEKQNRVFNYIMEYYLVK